MEVLISRSSELCWPEGHPSPTEIPRWPTLLGFLFWTNTSVALCASSIESAPHCHSEMLQAPIPSWDTSTPWPKHWDLQITSTTYPWGKRKTVVEGEKRDEWMEEEMMDR